MSKPAVLLLSFLLLFAAATVLRPSGADVGNAPDLSPYPWFYLRDGQPLAPGEDPAELLLLGDVSFGRETGSGYRPAPAGALSAAAPWLRPADLVFANLESALVATGTAPAVPPDAYLLRGEPAAAFTLAAAGIDLAGTANNHAWDYGPAGLAASQAHLRRLGVAPVGATPLLREIGGVRVSFLAFNQVPPAAPSAPPLPTAEEMVAAVAAARARADLVVVSIHWGYEYQLRPDPAQERLARALVAAGAGLIAGHHPHVVQPVALLDGAPVAYSLGNFLFDQGEGETGRGLALRVLLDRQGLRAVQGLPLRAGLHPALLPVAEAGPFLDRVAPPPLRVGFTAAGDAFRPLDVPPGDADGRFRSGQADLTGDGRPEQVRLEGARARIYGGGALLWQSPPAWEVADLALGDPNDDGRRELLLAVWKKDPAGHRRSHPYLVGYRGGAYTLMWGGRAVAAPLAELELGDVDGDGREELLVVQVHPGGERTLAVWRWHGWGFTLLWQSPPGPYRDLILHSPPTPAGATFSATLLSP